MKTLSELDASFISVQGRRVALGFCCPCCIGTPRETRIVIPFSNPPDGGPPAADLNSRGLTWRRTGETLDDLSLSPSIDASGIDHFHGFVENGKVRSC